MKLEYCCQCAEATGRAGAADDSLYTETDGPFCENCFPLVQPEHEPVASIYITPGGEREFDDWRHALPVGRNLLYTSPPQREWAGLTEDEIDSIYLQRPLPTRLQLIVDVQAKLKEKNT